MEINTTRSDGELFRLDWGWPSADLHATDSFQPLFRQWSASPKLGEAFFYGEREGSMRTRESFARALCPDGDQEKFAKSIIVTSGAGVGLDLILGECQRRTKTCFAQSLTYHNALGIIRERGFSTLALAETEDNELDLEKIETQFRRCPGAICYLVPTYSNPCSDSLDIPTREALVGLALRHDIKIIADEVYRLLPFRNQSTQASLVSLDPSGECVVSLGSFTKIAGPGLRLGWLEFGSSVAESSWATSVSSQSVFINGGCLNQFSAWVVSQWLDGGCFPEHLSKVQESLATRADALFKPLDQAFQGTELNVREPQGGYFVWIDMPAKLLNLLSTQVDGCGGVRFRDSTVFQSSDKSARSGCRLSFSYYSAAELRRAAERFVEGILSLIA